MLGKEIEEVERRNNREKYPDPTADQAIAKVYKEQMKRRERRIRSAKVKKHSSPSRSS